MGKPVFDPAYWRERLRTAGVLHHAIYVCSDAEWQRGEEWHRAFLAKHIRPMDSVLDVGCGWGRLLRLMPKNWEGQYVGVDLSKDLLALVSEHCRRNPCFEFIEADARNLSQALPCGQFDWAVMISFRSMIQREAGAEAWAKVESEVRQCARKLMYLEYREQEGVIE